LAQPLLQHPRMKKLLLLLLFPLLHNSFSQSLQHVTWSEPLQPTIHDHLKGLYGSHNFAFMAFTNADRNISNMSLVGTYKNGTVVKADHNFATPAHGFIGGYVFNNQMVVVLEFQRKEEGQFIQEIKSFAFANGSLSEEKTLLTNTAANKTHLGKVKFAVSPNRKQTLIFVESPYKQGTNEEVKMIAFDEHEQKHYAITLFIESKQGVHNYPQVANNGTVYFLKRDKDKTQQFRYYLYAFDPATNNLSYKHIVLGGTSISDIRGTVTPQNDFLVGGFTSSDNTHVYEGYFLMKLDQTCMPKFKTQAIFDEGSFLKFISKKEYSKNPAIPGYFIENITVGPTGKIMLAAEAYEEGKPSEKESWYHYNDVMLVCFNESGEYKTTFKIEKEQGMRDGFTHWASYKTFYNQDTLVVLHNNMVRIEGAKGPEPLLLENKVHEKFGVTPTPMYTFDQPREAAFFNPDVFMQEDEKHYTAVFSTLDRKVFRLARVEL